MYTFLNQRYGLKSLIVDWAAAILNGVRTFHSEDHDVALFGKILSNECDEEFRFIQLHIRETIVAQLRGLLKERHPYKTEVEVGKIVSQIQDG